MDCPGGPQEYWNTIRIYSNNRVRVRMCLKEQRKHFLCSGMHKFLFYINSILTGACPSVRFPNSLLASVTFCLPPGQEGRVDHLPRSRTIGLLSCVGPPCCKGE